ncbi:hypothetical protein CC80DRAFT_594600 [Byssothecium circinans]|uniref:Uncharacterized protein n=1 Tax=Byssothecium circinans TaxID=147558 RepID=A0A6A5TQH1_9PLEO|nr:hypothetical protein CC80DRAFT_594600 [Byssothecium circinans]
MHWERRTPSQALTALSISTGMERFPAAWVHNRDQIQANFRSLYTFGNGWWFHSKNAQIFCHDKSLTNENKDDCAKYPGHIVTVNRYEEDHDAMMFCDSWFALRSLPNALAEGLVSHDPFDISNYENRAIYLTSALCIKQDICRWPRRSDGGLCVHHMTHDFREWGQQYVSTPSAIKWLAKERDPLPAMEIVGNVDMYGWWAMTSYVMENRQLGHYPARPYVPLELKFPDVEPGPSAASDLQEILNNTIPDVGVL